eukprot:6210485-Pleurochrysis_carterae.AAC.1
MCRSAPRLDWWTHAWLYQHHTIALHAGAHCGACNSLEWELQQLDTQLGIKPHDEQLAQEVHQLSAMSKNAALELQTWEAEVSHHRNSLD